MNGVIMPGVSAGSNHVGARVTCTPQVRVPSAAAAGRCPAGGAPVRARTAIRTGASARESFMGSLLERIRDRSKQWGDYPQGRGLVNARSWEDGVLSSTRAYSRTRAAPRGGVGPSRPDLLRRHGLRVLVAAARGIRAEPPRAGPGPLDRPRPPAERDPGRAAGHEIGRASCRERVVG